MTLIEMIDECAAESFYRWRQQRDEEDAALFGSKPIGLVAPPADDDASSGPTEADAGNVKPWRTWLLPEDFWGERPALKHIRQAAFSRCISPDAVLGVVLARVASQTHHAITIPAIVGRRSGPDIFINVVGSSGVGKGAACDCAAELVPPPRPIGDNLAGRWVEVPIGSGEGLVKAFHSVVEEDGDNGKPRRVQKQTAFNAFLRIDEAETLGQLAQRRDQTTMTTLRKAWSREELGAAYADEAKNLRLPAGYYRVCVVMGVQPMLSRFLFDDAAGGTPQRFSWFSATYPPMPDTTTEWPGPLQWRPPRFPRTPGGDMGIDDAVTTEIKASHLAAVRGKAADDLDGHARLVRLKLAAALAILDNRLHITTDDWRLSGIMATTSDALRDGLRHGLQLEAIKRGEQQIHLAGRKRAAEIDAEEKNQEKRLEKAVGIIVTRLRREGAPMPWRTLRDSLGSRYRDVSIDARTAAVERGLVVEADGVWSVP